jgi:hypothetical protein
VCGEPYDAHDPLVSVASDSVNPPQVAPNQNPTSAVVARNPPGLAYTNTPQVNVMSSWNHANARATAHSTARNPPDALPTAAANRERMVAAVRHRDSNSRVRPPVSDNSSLVLELNCAVWPFVVSIHPGYDAILTSPRSIRKCFTRKRPFSLT